jgi:hypothetical protein
MIEHASYHVLLLLLLGLLLLFGRMSRCQHLMYATP